MGLLDGKQLRDGTLSLDKVAGTGLVTFTSSATMSFQNGAVLRRDTIDILVATDVVNKEYVDAVAAGLNPKASSRVIYNGDITALAGYTYSNGASGVGATLTFTGFTASDSVFLSSGDRIIINSTTDQFVNGIYVYGTTASFFTRATDFDGSVAQEVDGGEFSFVKEGTIYGDTGWVVSSPNSTATIGVTPIIWVQFSAVGVLNAGDGLYQTGNNFNVGAGTGLTVSANSVSIANTAVAANTYGSGDQAVTFTVNAQGQLTAASTQSIAITSTQVTDFTSASETAIFTDANFVDGITITFSVTPGSSVAAEVVDGSLGTVKLDTNGAGATAGYILSNDGSGNFVWTSPSTTDITGITAGAGLTGGGASGYVTLDVNTDNGLSIVNDNVVLGGTLSQNTVINGAGYDLTLGGIDYILMTSSSFDVETDFVSIDSGTGSMQLLGTDITLSADTVDVVGTFSINGTIVAPNLSPLTGQALIYDGTKFAPATMSGAGVTSITAGAGLTATGTTGSVTLNIGAGAGITVNADDVAVNYTAVATQLAGDGLVNNGTTIDVTVANGLTVSGDVVQVSSTIAGTGLTFSAGVLSVVAGNAQPVYQSHLTPSSTTANTNFQTTGLTLSFTPNDYSRINVFVNGQLQYVGNAVSSTASGVDCYFSADGGVTAKAFSNLASGDTLYWNGNAANAGFKLDSSDKIDIIYEA